MVFLFVYISVTGTLLTIPNSDVKLQRCGIAVRLQLLVADWAEMTYTVPLGSIEQSCT